jgi:hypothetical protein
MLSWRDVAGRVRAGELVTAWQCWQQRTSRGAHRRCVRTARRQEGSARYVATSAALEAREAGDEAVAAMPSMQKRRSSSAAGTRG